MHDYRSARPGVRGTQHGDVGVTSFIRALASVTFSSSIGSPLYWAWHCATKNHSSPVSGQSTGVKTRCPRGFGIGGLSANLSRKMWNFERASYACQRGRFAFVPCIGRGHILSGPSRRKEIRASNCSWVGGYNVCGPLIKSPWIHKALH